MRRILNFNTAAFIFACALAPCTLAQTPDAQKPTVTQKQTEAQKPAEAVRERRVESQPSRAAEESSRADGKASGDDGAASQDKGAASRVEADSSATKAGEPADRAGESSAKAGAADTKAGADAEVESLRARADAASSPSERGRLRQSLAERLAEVGRRAEAVEVLRAMLAEERFDPPFFYNAGNALARLGESDAAADAYQRR